MDWVPHEGIWPWRLLRGGPDGELLRENHRPEKMMPVKKRQALGLEGVAPLPLPLESAVLKKFPRVLEFLIATAYDDGTVRTPGSLRVDNKLLWLTITLYDADAGMRLPCTGSTFDDALSLAEKLLGAEEAPWEVDRYLTEQLQRKVKKGGSGKKKK